MEKTITKSTCRNCHGGCGTLVTKENDKVIEVYNAFDPTAYNAAMSN